MIVFSSSHKLRPLEMETIIQGNHLLSGALIVGQGKPQPVLIGEPKPGAYDQPEVFIDRIWDSVEMANGIAPGYAQLRRSRTIVADPRKPFIRAPKGTIVRKLTIEAYTDEIEEAYADGPSQAEVDNAQLQSIDSFILPGIKTYVSQMRGRVHS
jgi:hypothetical protein